MKIKAAKTGTINLVTTYWWLKTVSSAKVKARWKWTLDYHVSSYEWHWNKIWKIKHQESDTLLWVI
jgi:hypothetical protein